MLCGTAPTRKGSLNNDDGDGNENGKKAISLNWQTNNFSRASALFLYISLPSWLDDYEVKMPNFTFYGERKLGTTNFFLPFLNLSAVPKKSTPGKLAHISHFQWIGINATKFEKTRVILKEAFSQPSPSSMLKLPYCGGRFISCVLVVLYIRLFFRSSSQVMAIWDCVVLAAKCKRRFCHCSQSICGSHKALIFFFS